MKQLMMMSALFATVGFSACAQKIDPSKVPVAVKTSFEKQYAGTTVKWEKENGKFEAGFKKDGNTMSSALYEANGTMTESEMDINVSDLPAIVLTYVKEHYKGKSINEGAKITRADDTFNYEAEVDGKDVLFNASGKFLKEVKD